MSTEANNSSAPELTISFAAAGWLQTYQFGVAKAIQELGLDGPNVRLCGSSAGALAASALISKVDFDALREYAVACVVDCHSSAFNAFRIREYVLVGIERFAVEKFRNDAQLREKLNKQFEAYVSVLPWCRTKVMNEFETAEDLEEALIASCCLVPLAGLPIKLRKSGEYVCDGGLTAFQPRKNEERTITVSAMYFSRADIRPSSFLPAWYGLYPPGPKRYREIFDEGYNDAIKFLVKERHVDASHLQRLKTLPKATHETKWDVAVDILTGICFFLFIRPWAVLIIYAEMFISTIVLLMVAAVHATKSAKWEHVYHSLRNMTSFRVFLHTFLGKNVPVNHARLERHSRVYRILKPILYG
ncbi:transmembrane protein, putative [Bodo saltans]|uniref:Transmembrane protein, putative n=1 Tax=Bodo saltans TaxID=75058 RepID=A0A0S4IY58_BODSA|nr:transmembrane protein, putative [Bodo saltans]|eukprot:CUG51552.1 transmembrane protein, putative [Bodo saltans]